MFVRARSIASRRVMTNVSECPVDFIVPLITLADLKTRGYYWNLGFKLTLLTDLDLLWNGLLDMVSKCLWTLSMYCSC